MDKKKATNKGSLNQTIDNSTTDTISKTDKYTQQAAIKKRLKQGSCDTLEFRAMGICSPATRIMELKTAGYPIEKTLITATDQSGVEHHGVACYFLVVGGNNENS